MKGSDTDAFSCFKLSRWQGRKCYFHEVVVQIVTTVSKNCRNKRDSLVRKIPKNLLLVEKKC